MSDHSFTAMGCTVRVIAPGPERAEAWVRAAAAQLTRFDATSELSALNADPRHRVPCSPLLRAAVAAALRGARSTAGLVDPTLLGAIETAGYDRTLSQLPRISLSLALPGAPERLPAVPSARRAWETVRVDRAAVTRPPGVRLDLGGSAKGLIADILAARLGDGAVVDCGGDIRVAGSAAVAVEHPLTGELVHELEVRAGAVATSGLARVWSTAEGPAHHLLDPSTGSPAWTGLAGATALAPTAVEAEALAKAAYLSGPDAARRVLARHGGALLHEDGDCEGVRPLSGHDLGVRPLSGGDSDLPMRVAA